MGRRCFKTIKEYFGYILDFIYGGEELCLICREYVDEDYICTGCKGKIKLLNFHYKLEEFDEAYDVYSLGVYGYELKELITLLKYKSNFNAAKVLADYMSDFILKELVGEIDIITYIPSSKENFKKRGFNQCQIIAKNISKNIGIPVMELAYKSKETKDQIGLSNDERWENMIDSFKVINVGKLIDKRILLIDDVITTGATAFYCASEIKKHGSGKVSILTIAKSRV